MLLLHHWQSEVCGLAAANGDAFGFALAGVGDVDGNGMVDFDEFFRVADAEIAAIKIADNSSTSSSLPPTG